MEIISEKYNKYIFDLLESSRGKATLTPTDILKICLQLLIYKSYSKSHRQDNLTVNLPENISWHNVSALAGDEIFRIVGENLRYIFKSSVHLKAHAKIVNIDIYRNDINNQTKKDIFNFCSQFDFSSDFLEFCKEVILLDELFDATIDASSAFYRRSQFLTSAVLNDLVIRLLNPGEHESFFVPGFGIGQIFLKYIKHIISKNEVNIINNDVISLKGCEQNYNDYVICILMAILLNLKTDRLQNNDYFSMPAYDVLSGDYFIRNKPDTDEKRKLEVIFNPLKPSTKQEILQQKNLIKELKNDTALFIIKYFELLDMTSDTAFLYPPFSKKIPKEIVPQINLGNETFKVAASKSDLLYMLIAFRNITEKGRLAVVLPSLRLVRSMDEKSIWQYICDNDYLEAIITLPDIIAKQKVSSVLLILNKNKSQLKKNRIAFIDARTTQDLHQFKNREISRIENIVNDFIAKSDKEIIINVSDIHSNNYNLSPNYYLGNLSSEIKQLVDDKIGRKLGDICQITRGRYRYLPAQKNIKGNIPLVSTKDLRRDVTDPYIDTQNISSFIGLDDNATNSVIYDKCVLVSAVGKDIKPTIYDPTKNEGIAISNNVLILMPIPELVDFEYLFYQLYTPLFKKQYEALLAGAGIPSISLKDLSSIIIPVPEKLDVQRTIAAQQKSLLYHAEYQRHQAALEKLKGIDQKKEAEFIIVRHLAHNIKPKIQIARSPIRRLKELLNEKGLLDEILFNRSNGSNETIGEAIDQSINTLNQIADVLDSCRNLVVNEINKADFRKADICEIFSNDIIPLYRNKSFEIELKCEIEDPINLHKEYFIEAINNLIKNAEDHAFREDRVNAKLCFEIREIEDNVLIDYTNNGLPFPKEMTEKEFLTCGKKRADSPGEGLGGAFIGKVLEAHNASFEIIHDNQPLHFRISIPRNNK